MRRKAAHERNDALRTSRTRYVAPFERDPARWATAAWVNLYSHTPYEDDRDAIALASIGDVLTDWQIRACVSKMRTPDGTRPHRGTVGLLVPMHVTASAFVQTGRETVLSDPLDAGEEDWHGMLDDAGMAPIIGDPIIGAPGAGGMIPALRHQHFEADAGACFDGLRAAIREAGISNVARTSGVSRSQLHRILGGPIAGGPIAGGPIVVRTDRRRAVPHPATVQRLHEALRSLAMPR